MFEMPHWKQKEKKLQNQDCNSDAEKNNVKLDWLID